MTGAVTDDLWAAPRALEPVDVTVELPGSKSLTNRELVLAALADGPGVVRRALRSRDTELMAAALGALGSPVDVSSPDWAVSPGISAAADAAAYVDCGLAGTVMRFVPPLAALRGGSTRFDGDPHARTRPMAQVLGALRGIGVGIESAADALPFTVTGRLPTKRCWRTLWGPKQTRSRQCSTICWKPTKSTCPSSGTNPRKEGATR